MPFYLKIGPYSQQNLWNGPCIRSHTSHSEDLVDRGRRQGRAGHANPEQVIQPRSSGLYFVGLPRTMEFLAQAGKRPDGFLESR